MNAGDFMDTLCLSLFDGLKSDPPTDWGDRGLLTSALDHALKTCGYSADPYSRLLCITSPPDAKAVRKGGLFAFKGLTLGYECQWPIGLVITSKALAQYGKVFAFFLQLKRVSHSLQELWWQLQKARRARASAGQARGEEEEAEEEGGGDGDDQSTTTTTPVDPAVVATRFRILYGAQHRMVHVMEGISGYLITQVIIIVIFFFFFNAFSFVLYLGFVFTPARHRELVHLLSPPYFRIDGCRFSML